MIEKITKTQMIENLVKKLKTRKSKNIIYSLIGSFVVLCFGYRFYSVSQENNFDVFNIIRNNAQNGIPVNVLQMQKQDGILYEPLTIKNNRAYVSGGRINIFKNGQKADNCKIISVSKNNKYHLPNIEIVNKLNKISNVYMTKDCGNIDIYLYKNKYNIKTYR